MEKISVSEKCLSYKMTSVFAPGSCAVLSLTLIGSGAFGSSGLFEAFFLVAAGVLTAWVGCLFVEVVSLELNHGDNSVILNRTRLLRFRPVSERRVFQLSALNSVWVEYAGSQSARVMIRFQNEWVPLTTGCSETASVREIQKAIIAWLEAGGLFIKTGEDAYLPKT